MTTPFWCWPRIEKYWFGKLIYLHLTRDHSISFDFRGNLIDEMVPEKERKSFWQKVAIRLNLLSRQN
jgi:hypothetical protein